MLSQEKPLSNLEIWLNERNLTINEFADYVGCHRETIRKIKQGGAVESRIARTVYFVTNGFVNPPVRDKGTGRSKHFHNAEINKYT